MFIKIMNTQGLIDYLQALTLSKNISINDSLIEICRLLLKILCGIGSISFT